MVVIRNRHVDLSDDREIRNMWITIILMLCFDFLAFLIVNIFRGKNYNKLIAQSWAKEFATQNSILDNCFSLLGVGSGKSDDSDLLWRKGWNDFRFYASGNRFCEGLVGKIELKNRPNLFSMFYYLVAPCKDEITFEILMNDDAMDHVVFAMAKKKVAKQMHEKERDLQRFAVLVPPPSGRKWVAEELSVFSESEEVAGDLITDAVLDQVFGENSYEKYRKYFISMHFSDQYSGRSKKMLVLKFSLPEFRQMEEMAVLVELVPYYIDFIGRYKLSPQVRFKTEAARQKIVQQVVYEELPYDRKEALQRKKAEVEVKRRVMATRQEEAKGHGWQMGFLNVFGWLSFKR